MGLDTALVETAAALFKILFYLVLAAILAGVFTLPLFYGVLAVKVAWFWALDVSSGGAPRRAVAAALRYGLPAFSLFATVLSLGYFGAFDFPYRLATGLPSNKTGPTQAAIKDRYDGLLRSVGRVAVPALPADVPIAWHRCPDAARELIELNATSQPSPPQWWFQSWFPPTDGPSGPPPGMAGPPPTPVPVIARAGQLIRQAQDGSLYENGSGGEISKEEVRAADDIYDRAVKDSKVNQDAVIGFVRGVSLFVLLLLGPVPLAVYGSALVFGRRGVVLVLRSLIRSLLRTSLTYLAVFVLVFILTAVWSVLDFLSALTAAKDQNMKGIVTEKYQIPSQMKPSHLQGIKDLIRELPPDQRPDNIDDNVMTWAFVLCTLDPNKKTFQNSLFLFATEPEKLLKMMPGMEDLTGEERRRLEQASAAMAQNPKAVVIGADRLRQLGKRVGDRMKVTSLNYQGVEFDFEIIAEFPAGSRWEQSAAMNRKYLDNEIDAYQGRTGKAHELADKSMNLIWVRLPNPRAFDTLSEKISDPGKFAPAIKMEIESSAYANFLSPYKTLISFLRYALAPGLLVITTLVASLVIGIGVRERRAEIAVLKVLGFRPWMVLGLVLGEALLIGTLSGFMATATAYSMVNAAGGIPLPIGFFGKFFIPEDALWWGPAIGGITSLIGAILPSATAYRIKASQVFSRVT